MVLWWDSPDPLWTEWVKVYESEEQRRRLCLCLSVLSAGVVMDLLEFSPVVDGDFIPDEPSKLFHNAAQFDYMAGVNSMDGHIFAGIDVPSINNSTANTSVWVLKHHGTANLL